MTVYIDNLNRLTSSDSPEELHRFAQSIGLKKSWRQEKDGIEFYFITTGSKKAQAIRHGAQLALENRNVTYAIKTKDVIKVAQPHPLPKGMEDTVPTQLETSAIRADDSYTDSAGKFRKKRLGDAPYCAWIWNLRRDHKLTNAEFGDLVGIGASTVNNMECGYAGLSESTALMIA